GVRADLHGDAIATLQNRSYDSGSPHRIAAYADPSSLFIWHGIVETERALHDPTVNIMAGAQFDPDNGLTLFKPEPSPALAQAQQSDAARKLLAIARFPKADIEKMADGYAVEIRDLRCAATSDTKEVRARVEVDANGKVLNDELVWARDAARH
ncbi:MAG: hypothetical protein JO119_10400, partial [Acidobacteria bacterium]|nr:hypothetical protein [Acidobacteriota bacterium]